jgi:membrane-associated phospholipid phosphatase
MTKISSSLNRPQLFNALLITTSLIITPMANATMPSSREWIKVGALSTASLAFALGARFVSTPECYWCKPNGFDETITRSWQANNLRVARITSDVLTFGLVPLMALTSITLLMPNMDTFLQDGLVITSAALSSSAIVEIVKISARRKRPEAYFGYSTGQFEDNRSFVSGHTSFSFSVLTSASILALKRGSRFASLFTGASAVVSASVGISRVIAAKHWSTDVLAGMVIGMSMGIALPFFILDDNQTAIAYNLNAAPDLRNNGLVISMTW